MDLLRKTQLERLFYLEFLAFFTGQVSRKDLVTRFGISEPAATKDISYYAEIAPNVITYDLRKKCYLFTGGKKYFNYDVDQVLFSLAGERAIAINTEHAKRLSSWVDTSIKRKVSLQMVATMTRCIYQNRKISAEYVSVSSGKKIRELSPMAIVHDGLRWHIRCYDHKNNEYRDYNLSRFNKVEDTDSSNVTIEDEEWNNEVTLKLIPHPSLEHPETVKMDYDIKGDAKHVKLKICLVGYFLRHWCIDYTDNGSGNPRAQQLFLSNKAELIKKGVPTWAFKQ
ncbi:MAG: WYL domain-containing protein [Bacteroidetes bacterium]|nr:WYL domain-containing protein [Bacteroidota bacterium]